VADRAAAAAAATEKRGHKICQASESHSVLLAKQRSELVA
jgi:hypothetical protein